MPVVRATPLQPHPLADAATRRCKLAKASLRGEGQGEGSDGSVGRCVRGLAMQSISYWLPIVWACLLGVGVVMYVLLDGFDLGIGILFLSGASEEERDHMMNSIAPYWDGNETWLVLGGAGLLVAFPLAYGIIMPALYLPLIVMLLALVFRGVAFEFRFVSKPHHRWWDRAFTFGSILATFCQGLVLGGFLQGIKVADRHFAGGTFEWLTPFSILCGFALLSGYALLGAGWLMMKTEGELAARARMQAEIALPVTLCFIAAVSIWTPIASERIEARWFAGNHLLYLWPVPFATAAVAMVRLDRHPQRLGRASLPVRHDAVPALLSGAWHLHFPLSCAAGRDHLGRGGGARVRRFSA